MLLEEMTWKDAEEAIARDMPVLIPGGSIEQHGLHLPLATDAIEVFEIAKRLAEKRDLVVAPTLCYTPHSRTSAGGAGKGFAGSIGIPAPLMEALIRAIVLDLFRQGFRRVIFLNGHFENTAPAQEALEAATDLYPGSRALLVTWTDVVDPKDLHRIGFPDPEGFRDWAIEHAGTTETSFIEYFRPDLVRKQFKDAGGVDRRATYDVFPPPKDLVPPTGLMGRARHASPEFGRALTEYVVSRLSDVIDREIGDART